MVRKCCHGNMEDPVAKKCHGNMEDPVAKKCHGNMEDPVAKKCHGNMEDPVAKKWGANTPHQTTTEHIGGIGNLIRLLLRQTCCGKFIMVLHCLAAVLCGEWSLLAKNVGFGLLLIAACIS